jgi:hypothetical protein
MALYDGDVLEEWGDHRPKGMPKGRWERVEEVVVDRRSTVEDETRFLYLRYVDRWDFSKWDFPW